MYQTFKLICFISLYSHIPCSSQQISSLTRRLTRLISIVDSSPSISRRLPLVTSSRLSVVSLSPPLSRRRRRSLPRRSLIEIRKCFCKSAEYSSVRQ
ncbi:hypothetical protein BVRB_2g033680 [Beta vulgaris subsp. vulgaris]|nr:hypothetical protein BVRB_2g033680 [Beta vulgaris subsp. vulgaris]